MKKKNEEYKPQTTSNYQDYLDQQRHFMNTADTGSLNRIKPYLENYIKDISNVHIGWTNYCLFRTPDDSTLTDEAMRLTQPIFAKLLDISKPRSMICVSKALYNFINDQNLLEDKKEKIIKINSRFNYTVVKAKLYNYDFFCLPHPNTPATSEGRKECWDFCFENKIL